MGKKDEDDVGKLVEELIADVADDRDRLSDFLDRLLSSETADPEHVAKIAAELTKQNAVKMATIKALAKNIPVQDDEDNDFTDEIGRPFPEDIDEGSN